MRLWQELRSARTWNSTLGERQLGYPCDRFVPLVDDSYYRAVDVAAPAKVMFRWLCQLQFGAYSYGPFDRFFGSGPRQLTPGADQLEVGQTFIMRHFQLVDVEPGRQLTILLKGSAKWPGTMAICYLVVPQPGDSCRLLAKVMVQHPEGLTGKLIAWALPFLNFVVMRKQLLSLKLLAERDRALTE